MTRKHWYSGWTEIGTLSTQIWWKVCAFTNDGLRFRSPFNVRIQNVILCVFEGQKTCGLRLHKSPVYDRS